MKTKIASLTWPAWIAPKLLPICLALFLGTISQSADAAPFRLVHAFASGDDDGAIPTFESSLTPSGSILYGMTQDGGKSSTGVLFQINTNGTGFHIIHTFSGYSVLSPDGSKEDGAYPVGTPVLSNSILYGMTTQGGSNGYVGGTLFSIDTGGGNFRLLHQFGAYGDGLTPCGTLVLSGTNLYGMTEAGGTNFEENGVIFSIGIDGGGYQILQHLGSATVGIPEGSLTLWGSTLYGMTSDTIFEINTDGTGFLVVRTFAGEPNDGSQAYGSLTRQGAYLYGMTRAGGQNNVGCVFQLHLIGSQFQILHSFALTEAAEPYGDLALSGATLYGMTYYGVTNTRVGPGGSGAVFQINTNGSDYQVLHTFLFPLVDPDGSLPFGTPLVQGSQLYGMTSLGGTEARHQGCIFALTIPAASESGGGPLAITTPSPLPDGTKAVAYHQQLEAGGGVPPYTWSVSSGHLPAGLTLTAGGLLSGKPTTGEVAEFILKVKGHDGSSTTSPFSLTITAPDKTPPTLTITSPKVAEKVTTPTLDVSGTAKDNVAVAGVYFQLNDGAWTLASTDDNFSKWFSDNLALQADANVFSAYAVDTSGNHSKTNTVKFVYYVTGPLIVHTNGSGTVTPNYNGKDLQIGATFSMTAKAGKGFEFEDWTNGLGIVLTNKATLKFVMASNLTLVADFGATPQPALAHDGGSTIVRPDKAATKPFLGVSGNYYGLFAPSDGPRQNTNSGAIQFTLAESGSFSGKLLLGRDTLPFSGEFDPSGAAQILVAGKVTCADCPWASSLPSTRVVRAQKKTELTVAVQLDFVRQAITGLVTDGQFVAQIAAYRNVFSPNNPSGNYQGNYAVTLKGVKDRMGDGRGTVAVDDSGNVTFLGQFADGTTLSQTSAVVRDGYWPFYAPLYGGNESFWAWNQFTNGTIHSLPIESSVITDLRGEIQPPLPRTPGDAAGK